jgi:tRNA nucleotidyltransferase (CCA-adding enzyme)
LPTESKAGGWAHFAHDADIGVSGSGMTAAEAFENAALALTAIVTDTWVRPNIRVEVACRRPTLELLFVDWLDAVIYEMAVRRMLFGRFAVRIDGMALVGELWGEPLDIARHAPACEPKGATLTALSVTRDGGGMWTARCVVDV